MNSFVGGIAGLRRLVAVGTPSAHDYHTVDDFRERARRRLPRMIFDFIDGGAEAELALRANRTSLDGVRFSPRYLVDVAARDSSTHIFGTSVPLPLILSPSGLATLVHPEGELAVARAAAEAGVIFCVSTGSGHSLEAIADVGPGRRWFQLYLWKSEAVVQSLIDRAATAGYEALIVTIDVPLVGKRERDLHNGMTLPIRLHPRNALDMLAHPGWMRRVLTGPDITFGSLAGLADGDDATSIAEYTNRELTDPTRTWTDLAMIRRRWDGPLIVKGVMSPGDAELAIRHGADGMMVSNHGGRQVGSVPGVAAVFPHVVDAVNGRAEVFFDGGIRRGEEIVKARALGAAAACGGRLWYWPLAANGEQGVQRVLEILASDVDRTLALIGQANFDDISGDILYGTE